MLDTRFPRIPGDMGNAATFPFPVRYHRVAGADPDLVVRRGAEGLLPAFIEGARALEREGVGAITTNCGFLIKYQRELAAAVSVPVFTSSLLLVPLVYRMLAPGRRVGAHDREAATLQPEHLAGAGIGRRPAPGGGGDGGREGVHPGDAGRRDGAGRRPRPRGARAGGPPAGEPTTPTSGRSCWSAPTCRPTRPTSSARPAARCSTSSRSSAWRTTPWPVGERPVRPDANSAAAAPVDPGPTYRARRKRSEIMSCRDEHAFRYKVPNGRAGRERRPTDHGAYPPPLAGAHGSPGRPGPSRFETPSHLAIHRDTPRRVCERGRVNRDDKEVTRW